MVHFYHFKIKKFDNIVNVSKPMYILLSSVGLFLYGVGFPTRCNPRVAPRSSVINNIKASFFTLILCASFAYAFFRVFLEYTPRNLMQANLSVQILMLILISILSYGYAFQNRKSYVFILVEVAAMWAELSNPRSQRILKYFHIRVHFIVFIWIPGIVLRAIILCATANPLIRDVELNLMLPQLVFNTVVCFFYIMNLMVVCLLKNIDLKCKILAETLSAEETASEEAAAATLCELEVVYTRAIEIKREINKIFQAFLLLTFIQTFHALLHLSHSLLSSTQANKIGQSLHEIPVRSRDISLYVKVQHFVKVMYFNDTELTVYGYFSLDTSLLFTVVASVVAYITILVKFEDKF